MLEAPASAPGPGGRPGGGGHALPAPARVLWICCAAPAAESTTRSGETDVRARLAAFSSSSSRRSDSTAYSRKKAPVSMAGSGSIRMERPAALRSGLGRLADSAFGRGAGAVASLPSSALTTLGRGGIGSRSSSSDKQRSTTSFATAFARGFLAAAVGTVLLALTVRAAVLFATAPSCSCVGSVRGCFGAGGIPAFALAIGGCVTPVGVTRASVDAPAGKALLSAPACHPSAVGWAADSGTAGLAASGMAAAPKRVGCFSRVSSSEKTCLQQTGSSANGLPPSHPRMAGQEQEEESTLSSELAGSRLSISSTSYGVESVPR
mmetsp:Transcript_16373/g.41741  ORF Transcript_16373/g.41741 Transcript_16373/m.41741 type:complete len:321 (+) Transcript_16373:323-1285(+)